MLKCSGNESIKFISENEELRDELLSTEDYFLPYFYLGHMSL